MANNELDLYRSWLSCGLEQNKSHDKQFVRESFGENLQLSPAYQEDAIVNGKPQPLVANRKETRKCNIAVIPGGSLSIGDFVEVFNEHWICVELYVDEYGMRYGELWMCNHVFHYQGFNQNIIHKYAVLDDGSYSKGDDKAIPVTENSFNCYIPLDEESQALHIDKRLGIGVIFNNYGNEILEVGKIKWIDIKSKNFGSGSHLMVFGIIDDQFNPEKDNIKELICDYCEKHTTGSSSKNEMPNANSITKGKIIITGRNTIKAGMGRTYSVCAIDETGETTTPSCGVNWNIETEESGISIMPNGTSCKVTVKEDDNLIGLNFILKCGCNSGEYEEGKITVEVT